MKQILSETPSVFSVEKEILEDRLDPMYYHPKYLTLLEWLRKDPHTKPLGEISEITRILGFETQRFVKYVEKGIPYLRVQDIKEFEVDLTSVKHILRISHEKLKRSQLRPNDIVLTITGRVGTAAVIPPDLGECNASQEIIRITLKKNINPHYVAAFLNSKFGNALLERWQSGATRPRTLIRNVRKIPISVPEREKQDRVARLIKIAYAERKRKLEKMAELSGCTSKLILGELGIKMPAAKYKEIYVVKAGELTDVLHPMYYHPKYSSLMDILNKLKDVKTLNKISKKIVSGSYVKPYVEQGTPYLRITNIKEHVIDQNNIKFVDAQKSRIPDKIIVKTNDVLLTRTGTIGTACVVPKELEGAVISQHLTRILLKDSINPYYVASLLNTELARQQMERGCTGSMQRELIHSTVESLLIPVPSLEIQNKIAAKVKHLQEEVERLQREATEAIQKAKKQVEDIIKERA